MRLPTYLLLKQRLSEYEAPPPQVREHSLHEPQASHSESRSSSERAVLELWGEGEEKNQEKSLKGQKILLLA